MTRAVLFVLAIALLLPAFAAQIKSVTRGGKKIDFIECEKCAMLAKWNEAGTYATINLSRLRDGNPSAAELSRREAETLEMLLQAMGMPTPTEESDVRVLELDASHVVSTRQIGNWVEVWFKNLSDSPRYFRIPMRALGMTGVLQAVDITDRAITPEFKDEVFARVPPRETKVYRLFPKTR